MLGAGEQARGTGIHNRIHWGVLRYIATYRRTMRPRVIARIEEYAAGHADVVLPANRRQTRAWLRKAAAEHA